MKAVKRFKNAIAHKRPPGMDAILGQETRVVQPPSSISIPETSPYIHRTQSEDFHSRKPIEQALAAEGVHRNNEPLDVGQGLVKQDSVLVSPDRTSTERPPGSTAGERDPSSPNSPKRDLNAHPEDHRITHHVGSSRATNHLGKGQAHDPLSDHLYLALGPGESSRPPSPPAVSDSPSAADSNIYEAAYGEEIQRLRSIPGRSTSLFLTRRVEDKQKYREDAELIRGTEDEETKPKSGIAKLLGQARAAKISSREASDKDASGSSMRDALGKFDPTETVRNIFTK